LDEATDFIKSRVHVGAYADITMEELADAMDAKVTPRKNLLMYKLNNGDE
jgi:hypothetical protein